jgi:prepilin-type N-terminal cleavage/methylation domain-containing protein
MSKRMPSIRRGFTLIEAMVSMAVLAIGLLGTFMGLVHAATVAREGQLRQFKSALVDAKIQQLLLSDKSQLPNLVGGVRTVATSLLAPSLVVGAAPWAIDPSAGDFSVNMPGDLGSGSVFRVLPDGQIRPISGTFTSCTDVNIPAGAYCRELLLQGSLPLPTTANAQVQNSLNATGARSFTLWVRVSRMGEASSLAVVERKVIVL